MTNDDGRRLREDAGPELRAALDAARDDGPTESELKAIAAGLPGLGVPAPVGKPLRGWLVPGGGAAVGLILIVLRVLTHSEPIAEPVAPPVIQATRAVAVREEAPPAPAPPPPPTPAPPVRAERPPAPHPVTPPAAPAPRELSEFELVDHAFQAARGGDAAGALTLVEEHARRFPHGALQQEREVLRIEALVALGRASEARQAFTAFEAAFPGSGHRVRILNLLDAGGARAP